MTTLRLPVALRRVAPAGLVLLAGCASWFQTDVARTTESQGRSLHDLRYTALDGSEVPFADHSGEVLLLVNTASECGFTPQYEGLESLHRDYGSRGLTVIGFPSNDFGGQEPLDGSAIQEFCDAEFGVTFLLAAKVQVKEGAGQSPVYSYLGGATGKLPGWNFCKYVVDRDGVPVAFFASTTAPDDEELIGVIEDALARQSGPN